MCEVILINLNPYRLEGFTIFSTFFGRNRELNIYIQLQVGLEIIKFTNVIWRYLASFNVLLLPSNQMF